jgi:hypothetical protein
MTHTSYIRAEQRRAADREEIQRVTRAVETDSLEALSEGTGDL